MKTFSAKAEEVERAWYVVDLEGQTVGRAATQIATILRGKHKPTYTPHVDTGDFVIVLNADKVVFKGNKLQDKLYHRFTGFIGGIRTTTAQDMLNRKPERVIELAVKGMLPKTKLGRAMFKKLKIYTGAEHPHAAQQPKTLDLSK